MLHGGHSNAITDISYSSYQYLCRIDFDFLEIRVRETAKHLVLEAERYSREDRGSRGPEQYI